MQKKDPKKQLIIKLPRYGLANKLITWSKAWIWCQNNHVNLHINGWIHFPLGSILRGEKSWRWYLGFFKNKKIINLKFWRKIQTIRSIKDQPLPYIKQFTFKATPYISDLVELSDYHDQIKKAFYQMIKQSQIKKACLHPIPIISVHIRRGDFVKIGSAIDLNYYINIIYQIRDVCKQNLPVTIFSDGYEEELSSILNIENTKLFKTVNDLVDLIVMSKSQILVTNLSSSYSYWAAFISDGIIIHHPDTWVKQCRPHNVNKNIFEGTVDWNSELPELLSDNLSKINPSSTNIELP